jgi:hypothetical protein
MTYEDKSRDAGIQTDETFKGAAETKERGMLSRIANGAFKALTVAALVVPLLAVGQNMDLVPGQFNSDSYFDARPPIVQMIEDFQSSSIDVDSNIAVLQPMGEFQETYRGPVIERPFDTHISMTEGMIGFGLALPGLLLGFRNAARRAGENLQAEVDEAITILNDHFETEPDMALDDQDMNTMMSYYHDGADISALVQPLQDSVIESYNEWADDNTHSGANVGLVAAPLALTAIILANR